MQTRLELSLGQSQEHLKSVTIELIEVSLVDKAMKL